MRAVTRRGASGQALVETALVAPMLVALVAGAGQIGAIAYGQISVDTAAREGARVAARDARDALAFAAGTEGAEQYRCTATDANPACAAVRQSSGTLSGSSLSVVITARYQLAVRPPRVERLAAGAGCSSGTVLETGTVSPLPAGAISATVSSSNGGAASSVAVDPLTGAYSICLSAPKQNDPPVTTTIVATAVDAAGCVSTGSSVLLTVSSGGVSPSPAPITLSTGCVAPPASTASMATTTSSATTTTTTTTTTTSSTSTASAPAVWAPVTAPSPPPPVACGGAALDGSYVSVAVSYHVPVFVPMIGGLFSDPGRGDRTVTATEVMRVEPCDIAQ